MSSLKPLAEPCPVTRTPDGVEAKRWSYLGKALLQDDVDRLSAKGVDWKKDIMPDGRLKLPKFRLRRLHNRAAALEATCKIPTNVHSKEFLAALWQDYQNLPDDPKPDYLEWAAQRTRKEQFDNLVRVAFNGKRDGDRIKATATLLEFSKTKPKQVIENLAAQPTAATPEQILDVFKVIYLQGMPPEQADKAIADLLAQVPKQ